MASPLSRRGVLVAGALFALAACSGGDGGAPDVTLKVADQLHALKSSLDIAGEGRPAGYRIEWSNFLGGPPIIAAQTGGSVDVGWMAETPVIFAQAAGSPIKVVAVSQSATADGSGFALVVKPGSPIHSVGDLKGRTVAYMKGTVLQYFVARLLEREGLSLDDIRPVQATGFGTGLLDKGAADAIVLAEPFLTQLEDSGKIRIIATGARPNTPGFMYLVASDAALADPAKAKAIGDLVARAARAQRWQRKNVTKAAPAIAKRYNVDVRIAERIIARSPQHYTPIDAGVIAAHQDEADLFSRLGLIRGRLDTHKIFDTRYNAIAAAQEAGA